MPSYKDDQQLTQRKMILTGKSQVMATPDITRIQLGVQTNSTSVTQAQSENATISQNIISSLRQMGITEIQTVQYHIEQLFEYQNGERIDLGYQVRNVFEIIIDDMELVGTIIDIAVNNGANIINSISFEVSDSELYYQQALNLAVKNAHQKANGIAVGLKSVYEPIPVLITENSMAPIPYSRSFAIREGALSTPIEPGSNQIEASVTIEFIF